MGSGEAVVTDLPSRVVEITSKPAAGAEPAYVSLKIDGDRKFVVQTADLKNIGDQLRGESKFSFAHSVGVPILITLLTVLVTTLVGQGFQYISWRNSNNLQIATLRAQRALTAYQKASTAMSKRYYSTFLYLSAAHDLADDSAQHDSKLSKLASDLAQQRFNDFYKILTSWNDDYDQTLSDIDYSLDLPVKVREHVSYRDFDQKIDCSTMLVPELKNLHLNVNSLKIQFAAINYCFSKSLENFNNAKDTAISKHTSISDDAKTTATKSNEDARSMSNEFRCFAQHRIAFLEQQKRGAIFKPGEWAFDKTLGLIAGPFVTVPDPIGDHFGASNSDCGPKKLQSS
jgi:hypothetical protein